MINIWHLVWIVPLVMLVGGGIALKWFISAMNQAIGRATGW